MDFQAEFEFVLLEVYQETIYYKFDEASFF